MEGRLLSLCSKECVAARAHAAASCGDVLTAGAVQAAKTARLKTTNSREESHEQEHGDEGDDILASSESSVRAAACRAAGDASDASAQAARSTSAQVQRKRCIPSGGMARYPAEKRHKEEQRQKRQAEIRDEKRIRTEWPGS